jgi:hypothetical protein
MTEPLPDLQAEAYKALEAFAMRCDGRGQDEVFNAFIAIAARCLNAAAVLIETNETAEDQRCSLCRASKYANDAAHDLARFAESERTKH